MKKFTTLAIIAIITMGLTACGGMLKGAATISGTGTEVYQSFDNVYEIIEDNIDAFSPRDVVRLRAAGQVLVDVKGKVCRMLIERGTALQMVADLPDLIPLYERARIAYIVANNIVMSEIDEFDRADQMTLFAFQETCLRFDAAIVGALNSGGEGNAQLVKDIMGFLFMVGKIVIPLIIL